MLRRTFLLTTCLVLVLAAVAVCSISALAVAQNVVPIARFVPPASSFVAAFAPTPSNADVSAIQAVIAKGNQEEIKAVATKDPTVMQDTATSSYYQQTVQILSDLLNSGVTSIQLDNLSWGPITLTNATTAQATTSETWSTTSSDGSTTRQTDTNVYTMVRENGAWKVQDDQHPDTSNPQQPSSNPGGATAPVAPNAPAPSGAQRSLSRNWSGYAATGGTFTAVSGFWTVPTIGAGTAGVDATWVGIGGVNSTDLVQAGTQAVVQSGRVVYSAWWETLPQVVQEVPLAIKAGDRMNVSISQQSGGTWQVSIKDATSGQVWQQSVTYRSSLSSAEWIEEAPVTGRLTQLPLDNFGTVTFSAGTTVENGQTRTIAQAHAQPISMGNGAGQTLAQPSALDANGTGFTVTRTTVAAPPVSPRGRRFGR